MAEQPKKMIRPFEAAQILGVSVDTLRRWRIEGRHFTKCVQVSKQHRFDEAEVLAYKEARTRN